MAEQSERLVVLTFDDGVKNHLTFVAPMLKRLNFGATFFISDDPGFHGGEQYLNWEGASELASLGFEIGNHLGKHVDVNRLGKNELEDLIHRVETRCAEKDIPEPSTFGYPGYTYNTAALEVLQALDYKFARRGVSPEFHSTDYGDRGPYYRPEIDHPLLIPTTMASGPGWHFDDFTEILDKAGDGEIIVITYHGVPDRAHPWVNTSEEDFTRQMTALQERGCSVMGLGDLNSIIPAVASRPDDVPYVLRLHSTPRPTALLCEYLSNPLGIDLPHPRFSWSFDTTRRDFEQRAYRILVSSTLENLTAGRGDMWDSGRISSSGCTNIEYAGKPLESFGEYWWTVHVWDELNREGRDADPAKFEMGIVEQTSWRGHWIGPGIPHMAGRLDEEIREVLWVPLLRKQLTLAGGIKKARAYISGLGWHELYINGYKIGNAVLDPAPTDYHKTVLYRAHDITASLRDGDNVLGIILGNGWYSEPRWRLAYGECPRALLYIRIEHEDGRLRELFTDDSWSVASGPILENQLWGGEVYDARLEKTGWLEPGYSQDSFLDNQSSPWQLNRGDTNYLDGKWRKAVINDRPEGLLRAQLLPEMRVNEEPALLSLSAVAHNAWLCEMGEFYGGWIRLRVKGTAGSKVKIRYSGRLGEDGRISQERQRKDTPSTDVYILKGDPDGEVYEPRFAYHPVKYVQIEGDIEALSPEDVTGRKIYNSIDLSGGFECSDPLLNKIHRAVRRTMTSQLFGIPLDCLYREHWGWTDPATITGTLFPRLFMPLFWHKWLNDIKDAQRVNGSVPDFAPDYIRSHGVDPAWGGNYPILVWYLYRYFGDVSFLQNHYQELKRQVRYFQTVEEGGILTEGHFGDHMLPGSAPGQDEFVSTETPRELVWSGYYYRGVRCVARIAQTLGHREDSHELNALADRIKDAFNAKWFDPQNSTYASGSQSANFIALALGIVPEDGRKQVLENTVGDMQRRYNGHHHTGNTGTTCMIETLVPEGYGEMMYDMLVKTDYPGWGYMMANGATTIWESWSGPAGRVGDADSMSMWATIDKVFYNDLAGIRGPGYYHDSEMEPGFRSLQISPFIPNNLDWAQGRMRTATGMVVSRWEKTTEGLVMLVQVPQGSEAVLTAPVIPSPELIIAEGTRVIWENGVQSGFHPGIKSVEPGDNCVKIYTGSGRYRFIFSTDRPLLKTMTCTS